MDYVKFNILNKSAQILEKNPLLNFNPCINTTCANHGKHKKAFYNGLTFIVYDKNYSNLNYEIEMEGSLGIYWSFIKHKFNNQEIKDIDKLFDDIMETFNFDLEDFDLVQKNFYHIVGYKKAPSEINSEPDPNLMGYSIHWP